MQKLFELLKAVIDLYRSLRLRYVMGGRRESIILYAPLVLAWMAHLVALTTVVHSAPALALSLLPAVIYMFTVCLDFAWTRDWYRRRIWGES